MQNLLTKRELKALEPYLVGEQPRDNGEWDMSCPLHEDGNRSANLNVSQAIWFCHAGCGGGPIGTLMDLRGQWVPPGAIGTNGHAHTNGHTRSYAPSPLPSEGKVAGWHEALLDNIDGVLLAFKERRGIYEDTMKKYQLGWDMNLKAYTIPIRNKAGEIANLRRYQPEPTGDRRKMWGTTGHNSARLYPLDQLENDTLIVCEGEFDALVTIQHGYPAITRTASASTWQGKAWNRFFRGKKVYLCHDCDAAGEAANLKVGAALAGVAAEVRIIHLPYGIVEKHGKDLTDFWAEHDEFEFEKLMARAMLLGDSRLAAERLPEDARVIDALDSRRSRVPLRLTVTIEGKASPGYTVPKSASLLCAMDAGNSCEGCPLQAAGGKDTWEPQPDDTILEMMDISKKELTEFIRRSYDARCKARVEISVGESQAVETLFVRPSIDHSAEETDYTTIRVRHVGGHDTSTSETVQLLGALYPSPKTQQNEFVAWEANPMETSIDRFDLDAPTIAMLKKFQARDGMSSVKKLRLIAKELEANVTHIYGRTEMHMAMDLVWHSGLAFEFDRQQMERGWLELLVVGDTRTGKSEAALRLSRHLGAGEVVSCETASLPGILGAVHQPTGQQWTITWGKIPLNDRRCVVLDEVGGLHLQEIAALSHLRSTGIAEINKVKASRTHARCRLIWLGNPREGKMSDYTFGIDAMLPLIGKPEDVARFDMCMSVASGEVQSDTMNRPHELVRRPRYTAEACHALLRWAWSRRSDQIIWSAKAQEVCFAEARKMGTRYVETPPLVQAANVRIKIARVATALALRTFSTDESYECCIVTDEHVLSAVKFLDSIYKMPGFGYAQHSNNVMRKRAKALESYDEAQELMNDDLDLARFLRDNEHFRPFDLESFLNLGRDEANATVNRLVKLGMIERRNGNAVPTPALREILRGIK